jgi:UDP-N-acetylglucosamine:LPS N-acetylglucosamine transferase
MKLCFVCSHGGHLAEAKVIAEGLKGCHEVFFITDSALPVGGEDRVYYVASFVHNPLKVFVTAWQEFRILLKERPAALVSTGAEVALPAFYIGKLFFRLPSVYVECSAQVVSPSLTGRLIYRAADLFLVQWEGLLKFYGKKARYEGGFI